MFYYLGESWFFEGLIWRFVVNFLVAFDFHLLSLGLSLVSSHPDDHTNIKKRVSDKNILFNLFPFHMPQTKTIKRNFPMFKERKKKYNILHYMSVSWASCIITVTFLGRICSASSMGGVNYRFNYLIISLSYPFCCFLLGFFFVIIFKFACISKGLKRLIFVLFICKIGGWGCLYGCAGGLRNHVRKEKGLEVLR